jgi:tryptophan synthase alpha chain
MTLKEHTKKLKSQGGKALAPFFTAGYPDAPTFLALIEAAEAAGSNLIEIGIPFSDPIADGPVIQASSCTALQQGMNLEKVLDLTREAKRRTDAALLLMGYCNPILRMGVDKFAHEAKNAGATGVIIPDIPLEESEAMRRALNGLTFVDLVARTSSQERIEKITALADGFLYLVSVTGVTGGRTAGEQELENFVNRVREHTDLPLYVGFGISTPEQAQETARHADGVIIGSALIRLIQDATSRDDAVIRVKRFLKETREAINGRSRP